MNFTHIRFGLALAWGSLVSFSLSWLPDWYSPQTTNGYIYTWWFRKFRLWWFLAYCGFPGSRNGVHWSRKRIYRDFGTGVSRIVLYRRNSPFYNSRLQSLYTKITCHSKSINRLYLNSFCWRKTHVKKNNSRNNSIVSSSRVYP